MEEPHKQTATGKTLRSQRSSLPRGEQAYQYILEAIQQQSLKPGDRLREADLAELIGLSRTPIREALSRLEAEGLIVNDSVRGMMVTELDYSMTSELYIVRELLEGAAARLAAQHASEVELTILQEVCANYEHCEDDAFELAAANRQFHDIIYRCAHNRYLLKTLNSLHDTMALLGVTTLTSAERRRNTIEEHVGILNAILDRNPDLAEQRMREHIRAAQRVRLRRLYSSGRDEKVREDVKPTDRQADHEESQE